MKLLQVHKLQSVPGNSRFKCALNELGQIPLQIITNLFTVWWDLGYRTRRNIWLTMLCASPLWTEIDDITTELPAIWGAITTLTRRHCNEWIPPRSREKWIDVWSLECRTSSIKYQITLSHVINCNPYLHKSDAFTRQRSESLLALIIDWIGQKIMTKLFIRR